MLHCHIQYYYQMAFTEESNWSLPAPALVLGKIPPSLLPRGRSCHSSRMRCHMVLNIRIKMSLCFLCEMPKFIRKSESLISTKFLRPAICCMRKKMEIFFFFNHLLIVKCECAGAFAKAGVGAGLGGGGCCKSEPEQARLAGEKGGCQLNGGTRLGKHNYGNHLFQSNFFFFLLLLLNTCSFHTETAEREAGSQEEAQSLCHREFQQAPAS